MNDEIDALREAFVLHEYLAPDPAAVRVAVRNRARAYYRRRRAAQAAGGAVLGAGLVAGGIATPGLLGAGTAHGGGEVAALASASQTIPSPMSSQASEQALNAYFAAGYTYNDAMTLAKLWNQPANALTIKTEAGRRLLAGQTLPIKPSSTPADPASSAQTADVNAFFTAGYTYNDAVTLAHLWKTTDTYQVKIDAGKKLLAGQSLPIRP